MSKSLKAVMFAVCVLAAPLLSTVGSAATAPAYSTQKSTVSDLFANPRTKAIVEKQFPGIASDFRMKLAKGKTFRELNAMNPKGIPADKLDAIDADLAKLPN